MALKHILQLDVPFTYNEGVFLIKDTSIYASLLPVKCGELQLLSPGYSTPVIISNLAPGFYTVFNACTLGIVGPTGCSDNCPNIPDGIYNIRYSVSPNDKVYVEYNHMRISYAMNQLNGILCGLNPQPVLPDQEMEEDISNISFIREYLWAAKTMVEDKNNPLNGINLYKYAVELIDKMSYKRVFC